jgi:hypothetical protein
MKTRFRFFNFVAWGAVFLAFVFAACSLPVEETGPEPEPPFQETEEGGEELSGEEQETPEDEGGEPVMGELSIRIGGMEKTGEGAYPDLGGVTRYRLDFSGEAGRTAESCYLEADGELTLSLEAGAWEIHAYGLLEQEAGKPPLAVICGSAGVRVSEGGTETALIVPNRPVSESGEPGFLSWNIEYPETGVWGAALVVSLKINGDTFIPYTALDLRDDGEGSQKIPLPPGTYRMEARFLSHHETAGATELACIYPGLETKSTPRIVPETAFSEPGEFSSVAGLKAYLDGLPENTRDDPYPVKITGVDLSSKEKTGETLRTLYDAFPRRYVSLDLRECTGTELVAASTYSMTNRANIVSLILPESITAINSNGFSGYAALKFAALPGVTEINTSAFKNCGEMEALFAPALETVAEASGNSTSAFTGCIALKALYAPRLETLGKYAFYGCSSLSEIAFPKLRILGGLAFKKCTALKALSLPSVTRIDSGSFDEDTAFSRLVLGLVPPELAKDVFKDTAIPQSGVIFVPPEALNTYKDSGLPNWSGLKEQVRPLPDPAAL